MNVLILRKRVEEEPPRLQMRQIAIDRLHLPDDAAEWLALRRRVFADQDPPVRDWTIQDFMREMDCGGRPSRRITWLARPVGPAAADACGAVSLSRPVREHHFAMLHWLMVSPLWRRQGVGTLLLRTAERYCWDQDWRELRLETHRNWTAAVQFYREHGYR